MKTERKQILIEKETEDILLELKKRFKISESSIFSFSIHYLNEQLNKNNCTNCKNVLKIIKK